MVVPLERARICWCGCRCGLLRRILTLRSPLRH
jgi:hypothetical protein